MELIPDYFAQKMQIIYEAEGVEWLNALPNHLANYAEKWRFSLERPVPNLSYNYVAFVTREDGTPAVFKIGFPNREIFTEMDTLEIYQGEGMVRLLAADRSRAAFLLERVSPGCELSDLKDDDEATRVIAQIIQTLRRPAPAKHHFPHLRDWVKAFDRYQAMFPKGDGPLPAQLIDQAVQTFAMMSGSSDEVLLHGDLHHFNVLDAGNGQWVAIDPKGVVGDCVFETARFLHNPYPKVLTHRELETLIDRRVNIVCDSLQFDRPAVLAWGFLDTMLSMAWSVEDGDDDGLALMLNFAEVLGQMG